MSARFLTERPGRAVLLVVAALAIVLGVRLVAHLVDDRPPRNDPATLVKLRSQFASSGWAPHLVSAYWSTPGDLGVRLDGDDRKLAMAACADLTEMVRRAGGNGTLFIADRSNELMVSNILSNNAGCQWRLN
jgi:hypothetical protein